MNRTSEKIAVFVGGTSGLGLRAASIFSKNGAKVVVGGRDAGRLQTALQTLGEQARAFELDVRDDSSIEEFFANIGGFDYLVITASSSFSDRPLAETEIAEMEEFARTKLWGALSCVRTARERINRGGSIVFISGAVSRKGRAGAHAKTVTNSALEGLTRSLSVEFGADIRVNCVSPAMFDSKGKMAAESRQKFSRMYPGEYVGDSNDVGAIIYSVSTNRFMTGSVIYVDGGWTAA